MLAYVQTASFADLRPRDRLPGVVLRVFRGPHMSRQAEIAEMDDLLGRVAAHRDRAAFGALFAHFAPRVKAYLMRLGAPSSVAEELAQEALLSVWRKAHLFDPSKASAATWLFTIARNLRIDAIRREKRPELDPEDFMPEPDPDADTGLMLAENEGRLRLALKQLPADQIQVVELSFFADKPHSQIAQELGIPLGTVKSRLRLAMARLKRSMGGGE
jgi:RNA polymerase sigma-70 factor (ECF subfamily)